MFAAFADGVLPAGYVCCIYCTYDVYVGINIINNNTPKVVILVIFTRVVCYY